MKKISQIQLLANLFSQAAQQPSYPVEEVFEKYLPMYLSRNEKIAFYSPFKDKKTNNYPMVGSIPVNKIHTLQGKYLFQLPNKLALPLDKIYISYDKSVNMQDFIKWGLENNKFSPVDADKEDFLATALKSYQKENTLVSMYTPDKKLIKQIPVNTVHLYKDTNNLFEIKGNQILPLDKIMHGKNVSAKEVLDWATSKGLLPSSPSPSMAASNTPTKPNS